MIYSDIKLSILSQFAIRGGNSVVPYILSEPGSGKSAASRAIARHMFAERGLEMIQYDDADPDTWETANYVEFNASLRDPVDILGTPNNTGTATRWKSPGEFYALRRGKGFCFLNLEELSDAIVPMQNALCSVIYDRRAGNTMLSELLHITATGNRTEDKSGANRITSKLAARTRRYDFVVNIEEWADWALDAGIDPVIIQFLRFRPNLLSDFDPNRFANPTPRSWERVSLTPTNLPTGVYFENVAGDVGEGAAAEYTGFRKIWEDMVDVTTILFNPTGAPVPSKPDVMYATVGALSQAITRDNFERVCTYLDRLPEEFNVMCVTDAIGRKPEVRSTKAYTAWAIKHYKVLL